MTYEIQLTAIIRFINKHQIRRRRAIKDLKIKFLLETGFPKVLIRDMVKWILFRIVSLSGAVLQDAFGYLYNDKFGILAYHRITDFCKDVKPSGGVSSHQFHRQLTGLIQRGFVFWPLEKLISFRNHGWTIPPYVTTITFDEGFASVYHHAWPILKKLNIPATIFIRTDCLDNPEDNSHYSHAYLHLTTSQCQEMADSGLIVFGSHSHVPRDFKKSPNTVEPDTFQTDTAEEDLHKSIMIIKRISGQKHVPFAFPYCIFKYGFADDGVIEAIKKAGSSCALNYRNQTIPAGFTPFFWGRFNVFPWDTAASLAGKLSGWNDWSSMLWERFSRIKPNFNPCRASLSCRFSHDNRTNLNLLHRSVEVPGLKKKTHTSLYSPYNCSKKEIISVIVPTYNRALWLKDALYSLIAQQTGEMFDVEIIVIDNCSADDTKEIVEEIIHTTTLSISYLFEPEKGDSSARNCGLKRARGDWIAFFDDDQIAEPDWLLELWRAAKMLDACIVGGSVKVDLSEEKLEELGPFIRPILRETNHYSTFHPYTGNRLPGTCNSMVARNVFCQVGLFNTSKHTGSDFDFFLRARSQGFSLWYTPHALIHHRIPDARLTTAYFRWESLSGSSMDTAHFDLIYKGMPAVIFLCCARVLKALVIHLPLIFFAVLTGDAAKAVSHKTRLWRAEGYTRRTLADLFPNLFAQKQFFDSLEFRKGRTIEAAVAAKRHPRFLDAERR
jgi:glucosyl-dolichyl phosphate glucuronosyltransferase